MRRIQMGFAAVGFLVLGVSQAHASGGHSLDYAEKMYAEYQAGTSGRVVFEVSKREEGALSGIANVPFGNLLAPRSYLLDGDQVGLDIQNTRFIPLSESQGFDAFMTEELKNTANGFESVGLPVAGGSYRTLRVRATINGERREHEAIEFCWATQNYCTVLDPTVVFADSMAENRVALASAGPVEQESTETSTSGEMGTAARCGLASNPAYIGRSLTWAGRTQTYKNIYGGTLVRKVLGGQQSGVRCDAYCRPSPYGYSYASSCQGYLGWSCRCDNQFAYGRTGGTGKYISQTKCTHRYALSAAASASVSNLGSASVSVNWTIAGTPDSNGGQYMDTCGWY